MFHDNNSALLPVLIIKSLRLKFCPWCAPNFNFLARLNHVRVRLWVWEKKCGCNYIFRARFNHRGRTMVAQTWTEKRASQNDIKLTVVLDVKTEVGKFFQGRVNHKFVKAHHANFLLERKQCTKVVSQSEIKIGNHSVVFQHEVSLRSWTSLFAEVICLPYLLLVESSASPWNLDFRVFLSL